MELYINEHVFSWLETEPLDLPRPPGLEWMTEEELAGYYLLFSSHEGERTVHRP